MLVLAPKYQEFVALVQRRRMTCQTRLVKLYMRMQCASSARTHSDAGNVAVVVNQAPLVGDQVQLQDMVVYLIGILVEATEGIDLVVSAIGDGGIDQTSGSLAESSGDLGPIAIHHRSVLHWRIGHDEGIIGGGGGGWGRSIGRGHR